MKSQYKVSFVILMVSVIQFGLFSQSIWYQTNPLPLFEEYYGACFSTGDMVWAVGEDAAIICSQNGGLNWQCKYLYENRDITSVFFLDELNGWMSSWLMYKTTDGGNNWTKIYHGDYHFDYLNCIFFLDDNLGWAGDNRSLIHTTDGGYSWEMVFDDMIGEVMKITFPTNQTGFAITDVSEFCKTSNAGENWELVQFNSDNFLYDIFFLDENNGWISSEGGRYFKTNNAGETWDTIYLGTSDNLRNIHFYDQQNGIILSDQNRFFTSDGGVTWDVSPLPNAYYDVAAFSPSGKLCLIDEYSGTTISDDYGQTLYFYERLTTEDLTSIAKVSSNKLVAVGNEGVIVESFDNGSTWEIQGSNTTENLTEVHFTSDNTGWVLGDQVILYTSTGGEEWQEKEPFTNHIMQEMFSLNDDWLVCCGNSGQIFKSINGGGSWEDIHPGVNNNLNDIYFFNENDGIVVGEDGTYLQTTNGGADWEQKQIGVDHTFYCLFFHDGQVGFLGTEQGILKTTDGGENWMFLWSSKYTITRVKKIFMVSDNLGWAVIGRKLYQTIDGGNNWTKAAEISNVDLDDLVYIGQDTWIVVGEVGTILKTGQGSYIAPEILSGSQDIFFCIGEEAYITADIIGDSLQVQWFFFNFPIPGSNTQTLYIPSVQPENGGYYHYEVFNNAGLLKSEPFSISAKPKVEVLASPQDTLVFHGNSFSFNLAVTGALPIFYQWQKNEIAIPGAIFNIYTIDTVQPEDEGYYRCIVSNDCNTDTTVAAKLTVSPGPGVADFQFNNTISIFPNPVKDKCLVKFSEVILEGGLDIYNYQGELVISRNIYNSDQVELSTSALPKGIYIIRVLYQDFEIVAKFVKD